jgi:hypothetical protein
MLVKNITLGDTALYVQGSMKTINNAVTYQDGTTALTGNFYHDAQTHAFPVYADGWSYSYGSIYFIDGPGHTPGKRLIQTENPADMRSNFDRGDRFVAFPNIWIGTDDTLAIHCRMGLDAKTIHQAPGKKGYMLLRSDTIHTATGAKVYDASLRISETEASLGYALTPGIVVVERDLSLYRINDPTTPLADYPLFAFASPMTWMKSGYFAGNWVRKLKADWNDNQHVKYVYGNETYGNVPGGLIIKDQYLWDPEEPFENGKAYLVKARPSNFDYSALVDAGGLAVTDAAPNIYEKGKFVFDGHIYNLQQSWLNSPTGAKENIFIDEMLFAQGLNFIPNSTINWVIGNSWTSAISVPALVEKINDSPLIFEPSIYVFPAGSTTYQRYVAPGWTETPGNMPAVTLFNNLSSIPSQSIFMIRVLPNRAQVGVFAMSRRTTQIHSTDTHNLLRASEGFQDEVLFSVSPESNSNIYDLTAVGIRPGAKETSDSQDIDKMYQENSSVFLLYSLSTDDKKQSVNVVPPGTESVKLCLHPGDNGGRMTLTASRTESIAQVWLEDLLTNEHIDLKSQNSYTFTASPQDTPNRFIVHFTGSPTKRDNIENNFLQCYYLQNEKEIVIKGLKESDVNSTFCVYDIQGRVLKKERINQAPEMHISINLTDGIYLGKLQGSRTVTLKFRK